MNLSGWYLHFAESHKLLSSSGSVSLSILGLLWKGEGWYHHLRSYAAFSHLFIPLCKTLKEIPELFITVRISHS